MYVRAFVGQSIASPDELLRLLRAVAEHSTLDRHRHWKAQKRSLARTKSLGDHGGEVDSRAGREKDPAQQTAAEDEQAHRLAGLAHADRELALGLVKGESVQALAQRLRVSVKTLRNRAERLRRDRAG